MDDQKHFGNQDEPNSEFADIYAHYKTGVHEVSLGVRTGADRCFVFICVFGFATFACVAVALAAIGHVLYSGLVLLSLLLCVISGAWLARSKNAQNRKEPTNKSIDVGTGAISEDST
jgi:hypothetical protein